MTDDRDTWLYQLAVRGALELPNSPFRAINETEMKNPKKLKAAERRRLGAAEMGFEAFFWGDSGD